MKHARADYGRIQDPAGLIPEDEPVFLLRAQDALAADVVEAYAEHLDIATKGQDKRLVELAYEQARRMREWPKKKLPDL